MTRGDITPGTSPSRTSEKRKRASKGRHHDVAGGHQAHTAAEGRTLDPRHHRGGTVAYRPEHAAHLQGGRQVFLEVGLAHLFHLAQVGAGAEHVAGGAQHHHVRTETPAGPMSRLPSGARALPGSTGRGSR